VSGRFALDRWIALLLLALTVAVYSQVSSHDFLNYDDPEYVTGNAHVRDGVTRDGLVWAFTSAHDANWIPLTWISHMLDCQVFGVRPGAQHLVNVGIHAFSTLLLFFLLRRMTGALWRSAFVAFVFALHPLHVESVAWIAERKDVLFALFWFLALWAYLRYGERPSLGLYLLAMLLFCCGLLSKPMMVTWPFAVLLLDVWPLKRPMNRRLIVEKIPFLALSIGAAAIAYLAQGSAGTVAAVDQIPLGIRLENAAVSYVLYLGQFVWPSSLAVIYPYVAPAGWAWIACILVLAGASYFVVRGSRRYPYLGVGWFWFIGTLLPVIGLVQVGVQARADRYTYIPLIGISILIAWGAADWVASRPSRKPVAAIAGVSICAVWLGVTWVNLNYWRNSVSLFQHAVEVTEGNYVAYTNLGVALRADGRLEDAAGAFRNAVSIRPQDAQTRDNLGAALLAVGKAADALPHLLEATRLRPDLAKAHIDLGSAYMQSGRVDDAAAQYRLAVNLQPANAEANYGLGGILSQQGRETEARPYLKAALPQTMESVRLKPQDADAHYNLGRLFGILGRTDEAIQEFSEAVRLRPDDPTARVNLGIALAGRERLNEALNQFGTAVQLAPGYVNARFNLAGTLAALGRMDEAIGEYSEVLRLQPDLGEARRRLEECKRRRKQ
jgi:protein O-mannosyl-transferase